MILKDKKAEVIEANRLHETDTGKGISESNQAAIFRRFYREEEVHDQQGVGRNISDCTA